MSAYLDGYGVDDARRERIVKRFILIAVILAVVGGLLYWKFRNFREERQTKTFLELLQKQDFRGAYTLWGCTEDQPCPEYSFEKFLEDWAPGGAYGDVSSARITRTRSCQAGIIQTLEFGQDDDVLLWVARSDKVIGFAPWPSCNPRFSPSEVQGP